MEKKNVYIGFSQQDRELLVRLDEKVVKLGDEMKDLKDGTKETVSDHERRIRFIERYMWLALGSITLISFALNYFHPFTR